MIYDQYAYLFPPRPENKIPREMIGYYEKKGYIAQVKKNGTCTVVFCKGDEVIFKTRHADEDHKAWSPEPATRKFFQGRGDGKTWNVFVGELLHSKTPHIKHQLCLFDMIVKDGVQLVGTSLAQRLKMLEAEVGTGERTGDRYQVHPSVNRLHSYVKGFDWLFNHLKPEDEGIVMKDPNALMTACFTASANSNSQVKSRIVHKNYAF